MSDEERTERLRASLLRAQEHAGALAGALVRRRSPRLTAADRDRVPVVLLPSDGQPVPVVPGEILVRADREGDRPQVLEALADEGFERVRDVAGATVAVYRDRADDEARRAPGGVERLARTLERVRQIDRQRGEAERGASVSAAADGTASAGPNHIVAMNWVVKGMIGPEPAETPLGALASNASPRPDGRRPLVVIVDTGLAAAHKDRSDGWLDGVEVPTAVDVDPLDEVDRNGNVGADGFLDLGAGHGTFIAGVVRQVEPSARVVVLRALDADGIGSEAHLVDTIARASRILQDAGGGVLNLSLGMNTADDAPPPALTGALDDLFAALPDKVAVVAAAGNDGSDRMYWPAALDGVHAVAGLTRQLQPSTWSSRGPWVTCSAVGEGIVSTFVSGRETPGTRAIDDPFDPDPDVFVGPNPTALWLGTSFAAPQVAAVLAGYMLDDDADVAANRLFGTGVDLRGEGFGIGLRVL